MGTIRANGKGVPKQITQHKLKKGELKELYNGRLMLLKWKDKKDVYIMSTFHDASMKEIGGQDCCKIKPIVCCDYNDTMDDVELSNCFLSSYPSARKRLKKYTGQHDCSCMDIFN